MWYVVVEHTIHAFSSYADGEKFYRNAELEYREPFGTQDLELAKLVQYNNIADSYLRGELW